MYIDLPLTRFPHNSPKFVFAAAVGVCACVRALPAFTLHVLESNRRLQHWESDSQMRLQSR